MALNRRSGQRFNASIWPGFVDAMTALLLVLIFVLTIFMVVQSIQNETITGQESELDELSSELNTLARALGVEQQRSSTLEDTVNALGLELDEAEDLEAFQSRLIDALSVEVRQRTSELEEANSQITDFEAQVALLLGARDAALAQVSDLEQNLTEAGEQRDALETALAQARSEIDAEQEQARLAAARREALEAMIADLETTVADRDGSLGELQLSLEATTDALNAEEAARLAEAAAAEALRARLENADSELTAMTLALEERRKEAEDTLTLLAAAESARDGLEERLMAALLEGESGKEALAEARAALEGVRKDLEASGGTALELRDQLAAALAARAVEEAKLSEAMSAAEQQRALLATAQVELETLEAASAEDQRRLALLNEQVSGLRGDLSGLQALLDQANALDSAADVRIEALGAQLNVALARVAASEKRRAELEAAERARLEAEANQLENYRSEFFGRLREVLGDQEGVQVVGDRFVFSSEVLFGSGSATLSPDGQREVAKVAQLLQEVAVAIPPGINWVIRVDGHTDNIPLSGGGRFADNWELSQARALSVVRFMVDAFGFPPERLAAAGFAEFQPVDPADTETARARNRRIELKLTER